MDDHGVGTELGGLTAPHDSPSNHTSSEREGRTEFAPNRTALEILDRIRERQKDRRETDPSRTDELIREARAGGAYGGQSLE